MNPLRSKVRRRLGKALARSFSDFNDRYERDLTASFKEYFARPGMIEKFTALERVSTTDSLKMQIAALAMVGAGWIGMLGLLVRVVVRHGFGEFASVTRQPTGSIERAPGSTMEWFARQWLTRRSYDHAIADLITDYRDEYIDALAKGDGGEVRRVKRVYRLAYFKTLIVMPLADLREIYKKIVG